MDIPARKILIVFYSLSGKTAELAREVAEGAREVPATEVIVKRVPELMPAEVVAKHPHLREVQERLDQEFPVATVEDLLSADAVAFGTPVHFGSFASQIKQFLDQLSPVWIEGNMVNKPAAVFCSAGSVHGGEEATLISLIIPLLNLGMIPVGIPYPIQGEGPEFDAGSPYGAIFVSGHDGKNELSSGDKKVARLLGQRLSHMAHVMKYSCEGCNSCQALTHKAE